MRAARPDLAIIGTGLMGHWHATTARRRGVRIVAVVDPDVDRARAFARRFGAAAYSDTASMLASVRPTAGHVCAPLRAHVQACEQLLAAGCHVMCEKPLAATAGDVTRLVDRARDAGVVLCPVHQFAWQRGVRETVARLQTLGEIRHCEFRFRSAGGAHQPASAQDDIVLDIVPHVFSVLARIFPQRDLAGLRWHAQHLAAGELMAAGALDAVVVSLSVSMSCRPTEASATLAGTKATAHLDFFHGFARIDDGATSRARKATRPLTTAAAQFAAAARNLAHRAVRGELAYPGLDALFAAFYHSIEARGAPPFAPAEILAVYTARDALARQALAR